MTVRFLSEEYFEEMTRLLRVSEPMLIICGFGEASVQWIVSGGPSGHEVRYHLVVAAGVSTMAAGSLDAPDVVIAQSYTTAAAIDRGDTISQSALVKGEMRVTGDLGKYLLMEPLFDALATTSGQLERTY